MTRQGNVKKNRQAAIKHNDITLHRVEWSGIQFFFSQNLKMHFKFVIFFKSLKNSEIFKSK